MAAAETALVAPELAEAVEKGHQGRLGLRPRPGNPWRRLAPEEEGRAARCG
jgi:hypothetical protein